MRLRYLAALTVATLASAPAAASVWQVIPAQSRIGFAGTHAGAAFSGRFAKWTAAISFDPARPAEARIGVIIDVASAATGDAVRDGALPTPDWFNTKAHPQARYVARGVKDLGKGRYLANGMLTIRGVSKPVALPFVLEIKGNQAVMNGAASVDRLAFGIGTAPDPSAEWVSRTIRIAVRVVATAKK